MGAAYNPLAWSACFSAQVSASASLAGLIFVAVSINLAKIILQPNLVARSAKALFTLTGVLLVSVLCLVPEQPMAALGSEVAIAGVILWLVTTRSQWTASHNNPYVGRRERALHFTLTQLSAIPFILAGASLLSGVGGGLYWLVPGTIFSFIAALLDGWVLLIEILR